MNNTFRTKYTYDKVNNSDEIVQVLKSHPIQNIYIVYDANIRNDAFKQFKNLMEQNFNVSATFAHDGKEPSTSLVDTIRIKMSKIAVDSIIGVGGGSTLDLMKALSVLHFQSLPASEAQGTQLKLKQKLYAIAIPTTAGSGSEATKSAVLTNLDSHVKRGVNDLMVLPEVTFLFHSLLSGIPDHVYVASIFDGFTHALESFLGKSGDDTTKEISTQAMEIFLKQFELLLEQEKLVMHPNILNASNKAGIAICNSETGPIHALSYPLSEYYKYGHGQAVGLLLPKVLSVYGEKDYSVRQRIEEVCTRPLPELIRQLEFVYQKYVAPFVEHNNGIDKEVVALRSLELKGAVSNSPIMWNLELSLETLSLIWNNNLK
jgi:alcohol dehydrogenase class IV